MMMAAALAAAGLSTAAPARDPVVGQPAPDVQLRLVDGQEVQLSNLRGQVVVLNFWATWCVPCRAELPMLDHYARARRDNGLRVFAVTTEDSLPAWQLRKLFAAMAMQPVRAVRGPYRVLGGVPTNYIIDRAGRVRYARAGAFGLAELNALLVPLLNEPAPAS
jgi:cytochrome c biogenesis protein CcmG, thiol:disulfide interchange protein DsbE